MNILDSSREIVISSTPSKTLQDQVDNAINKGAKRIVLDGTFTANGLNPFSLLTVSRDVEIIGKKGATLDGQQLITHLLFVADGVRVTIKDLCFLGGNTQNIDSQLSSINHPHTRLNIFRYLDGGAITLGEGSEVLLEDCSFIDNHSAVCGGAISNLGGYLHVKHCIFTNNTCGDTGAAIDNLGSGSLTVVEGSQFSQNKANQLGLGTYGAITAFPDTYLYVTHSDFSEEHSIAIDYKDKNNNSSKVCIDSTNTFNKRNATPIIINPHPNKLTKREIIIRSARLFMKYPQWIKWEGIPSLSNSMRQKHIKLFNVMRKD